MAKKELKKDEIKKVSGGVNVPVDGSAILNDQTSTDNNDLRAQINTNNKDFNVRFK